MRRIDAQDLVPEAPNRLAALLIRRRPPEGRVGRLCAGGDVGFSGRIAPLAADGHDPFHEIAPVLRGSDLAFANLETPLVEGAAGERLFAAPPSAARALAAAGFGLLNLANNHVLDHGAEHLAASRRALSRAGITVVGAGGNAEEARRLVTTPIGGLSVGWLACARTRQEQDPDAEGFWEYDPAALRSAVHEAKSRADVLVVSIHMGYMYLDYPDPVQRAQVLALLGDGADLVVVHHAHVLQGVEEAPGGGLACYNLGNLLLDWEEGVTVVRHLADEQRTGGIFVFDLDRRGVARAAVLPVRVDDDWTVRWATGETGRKILDRLERVSDWGRDTKALFLAQRAERNTGLALHSVLEEVRRGGPRAAVGLLRRLRGDHLRMMAKWLMAKWLGTRFRPGR